MSRRRPPAKPVPRTSDRPYWALAGLLAVAFLALAVTYSSLVPFGRAPDESAHWEYVEWLATHQALPVFRVGGPYEFHQPPLYYALAALAYPGGVAAARLVNVLFGLLLAALTWLLVMEYTGGRRWPALGAAGIAAFLPMQLFLDATVNNDVLLAVLCTAALWQALRMLQRGPYWRPAVALGLCTGLGLLTKSTAVALLPVSLLAIGLAGGKETPWRPRLAAAGLYLVTVAAVGGWWLARNQALYGDPLAMRAFTAAFTDRPGPTWFLTKGGLNLTQYIALVAGWTWASFWGVFGTMNVFMPTGAYVGLAALPLLALAGLWRPAAAGQPRRAAAWLVMLGLAGLLLLSFVQFNITYFQAQARYLLPGIAIYALALAAGWERLAGRRPVACLLPAAVLLVVAAFAAGILR